MDVTEQAEEQVTIADVPPDGSADVAADVPPPLPEVSEAPTEQVVVSGDAPPALPEAAPPPIGRVWLRLAYIFEFWVVLIAIALVWNQVSGQDLDVMAWYFKLFFPIALSLSVVRMTVAIAEAHKGWNSRSAMWLLAVLVIVTLMSIVNYWYHLHSQTDEGTDENSVTTVQNWSVDRDALRALIPRGRENC